jgi:SpoVK/Ycf46/Vps4 family AAA+-type ATPase
LTPCIVGAAQKNNHGNLPLHYAAHYNAPLEVVEALYKAYPEGALQKNNDNNTPLDLAIADGASPNVVALLQGKAVPPGEEEVLSNNKERFDKLEKELQSFMERHDNVHDDLTAVLDFLTDIKENHPHALYCAGMNPEEIVDVDSLLREIRKAAVEDAPPEDPGVGGNVTASTVQEEVVEDAVTPARDEVERLLSKIVGFDEIKNQMRGLRRTIELNRDSTDNVERKLPPHLCLIGNVGSGKTFVARILGEILHRIGAVDKDVFLEVGRNELVEKSEAKTIEKTKLILERARGGVLFVDEAYTMLPSTARRGSSRGDHGAAALRTIAEALPNNDPFIILSGFSSDLQLLLTNNAAGFKSYFLMQVELPDAAPISISEMFMSKAKAKGFIFAEGVTLEYIAELIQDNTKPEWRAGRNGRVSELLLSAVRSMIKHRNDHSNDRKDRHGRSVSPARSVVPVLSPISHRFPVSAPEDVVVTVEDMQNAFVNGL